MGGKPEVLNSHLFFSASVPRSTLRDDLGSINNLLALCCGRAALAGPAVAADLDLRQAVVLVPLRRAAFAPPFAVDFYNHAAGDGDADIVGGRRLQWPAAAGRHITPRIRALDLRLIAPLPPPDVARKPSSSATSLNRATQDQPNWRLWPASACAAADLAVLGASLSLGLEGGAAFPLGITWVELRASGMATTWAKAQLALAAWVARQYKGHVPYMAPAERGRCLVLALPTHVRTDPSDPMPTEVSGHAIRAHVSLPAKR